ncbi:MAG: hypothetical protein AB1394_03235 [Bacteroidota bacterium]
MSLIPTFQLSAKEEWLYGIVTHPHQKICDLTINQLKDIIDATVTVPFIKKKLIE